MTSVAVIGAGLIGRAWAIVFARAGMAVALHDPAPGASEAAVAFAAERLPELRDAGLLREEPDAVLARLRVVSTLEAALGGAEWVQENGPERVEAKRDLFAALDRLAAPGCVLASSTSAIPASEFTGNLRGRDRCLVAHPVNPPYLVPVVEVCPAPWTDPAVVARARAFMERAGMVPATINREVQGFVLNRLQAALVAEAFRLVDEGIVSQEDLDATVKHGLGLRWSFMGPFETCDLNAPGGLADYCARYAAPMTEMQRSMPPAEWTPEMVARLDAERRAALPMAAHAERQAWRDRRLMGLLAHKTSTKEQPPIESREMAQPEQYTEFTQATKLQDLVDEYNILHRTSIKVYPLHTRTSWGATHESSKAGCYAMYDGAGNLLYIGKASHSRVVGFRLWHHFRRSSAPWMPSVAFVQIMEVSEPYEAPSLEEYLIWKLQPRFSRIGVRQLKTISDVQPPQT